MAHSQQFAAFIEWWRVHCKGKEKGEAQIFLTELLEAFGYSHVSDTQGKFEYPISIRRNGGNRMCMCRLPVGARANHLFPRRVCVFMKLIMANGRGCLQI